MFKTIQNYFGKETMAVIKNFYNCEKTAYGNFIF